MERKILKVYSDLETKADKVNYFELTEKLGELVEKSVFKDLENSL